MSFFTLRKALAMTGKYIASKIEIMAMTHNSSVSVRAFWRLGGRKRDDTRLRMLIWTGEPLKAHGPVAAHLKVA
jgi:hypothetical protein